MDARENARQAVEHDPIVAALATAEAAWDRYFWKCLMLATDLETLEALLDGETVPIDRLDPEWMERFGRRR
jgi:hypothetical protein